MRRVTCLSHSGVFNSISNPMPMQAAQVSLKMPLEKTGAFLVLTKTYTRLHRLPFLSLCSS